MASPKKQLPKKRSSLTQKDGMEPPKGFDHTKHAGRWISDASFSKRSDGYEPRGFTPWKDENGNIVRNGTLTWGYISKEEALAKKQDLFDAALDQRRQIKSDDEALTERMDWELRQVGGGVKGNIDIE